LYIRQNHSDFGGGPALLPCALVGKRSTRLDALEQDLGELLSRLNRALLSTLEYSEVPLFASAFYLLADLEKGEMRYANAGHPNPLRIHCARDRAETYALNGSKHGPALGLFDDAVYANSECELSPQDTLLSLPMDYLKWRDRVETSMTIGAC
jgi:serine phosphatase RsbU (regulator of sigma subunit)